jgi:hypothetical protein
MLKYGYGSTPIITIFAGNNHPLTIYFKVPRAPGFWLISIFWSSADQWFSMMWASVHSRKAQWFLRGFAGCRAPFWTLADYVSSDGTTMYNMRWDEAIQAIFTEVKSGFFWSWTLGKHIGKNTINCRHLSCFKLFPFFFFHLLPLPCLAEDVVILPMGNRLLGESKGNLF